MERISALIEKLRNQFAEGADIEQLLLTTQLLEGELRYHRQKGTIPASPHVAVLMPNGGTRMRQEPVSAEATPNRLRPEPVYNNGHEVPPGKNYETRPEATPNRGYESHPETTPSRGYESHPEPTPSRGYESRPEATPHHTPENRPEPVREAPGNPEHERYMPHKREEAAASAAVQPAAFEQAQYQASGNGQPSAHVPPTAPAQPSAYVQPAAPVQSPAPAPQPPAPEPPAFNPIKDVPTLTHQLSQEARNNEAKKDLNDIIGGQGAPSLNDRLKGNGQQREISSVLTETPIRDLRKAIGINDRYVFISELFRGDETMYERSIKTINNFSIYQEAYYWMERELKLKLAWDTDRKSTQLFYQLVRRRFS